eukprot:1226802-Pleurochrysis_carterae.AAC.1
MSANAVGEHVEAAVAARNEERGRLRRAERVGAKAAPEGHAMSCFIRGSAGCGVHAIGLRWRIGRRIALMGVSCDGVCNGFYGRRRCGGLRRWSRPQRLTSVRTQSSNRAGYDK